MTAKLRAVHPVLPSQDVRTTIAFFARLGFHVGFQDSPDEPGYAGVRRDAVELHVQWHDAKEWSAVERPALRILVADVRILFEEFATKGVFHEQTELRETPWGTREFAFFDPFHNGLTFYEDR